MKVFVSQSNSKESSPAFQSFKLKTVSVVGGWQLAIEGKHDTDRLLVGPVFRSTKEAWAWQSKNISKVKAD